MVAKISKNRNIIYGTVLVLVLGFLVLVGLTFIFTDKFSFTGGKCVAVVNIDQEITVQGSAESLFATPIAGSEGISRKIEELEKRDDVGSVLFVINSPGGSVVGSREIYNSIMNLSKPKVAYFREVAASGGYYISAPMDYIVSDPATLTGSIGVIVTFSDLSGLFEKIGYNMTSITSGELKDIGSPARPMTDQEKELLQSIVDEIFQDFKSIVIKHRGSKLNMAKFEEILDGRILTGKQAKEIGLVDAIGTKKDALKKAKELADLSLDSSLCDVELVSSSSGLFGLNSFFDQIDVKKAQFKLQ